MPIQNIIWLYSVEAKIIDKHNVWPEEVEEVLRGKLHIRFMEKGHRPGEDLYAAFGQSDDGRYLAVFYIRKTADTVIIVTARDMTSKEKNRYGRKR
ncbi:MAG: BrnT family toxin [Candidatus Promineifilaceae bacterium]